MDAAAGRMMLRHGSSARVLSLGPRSARWRALAATVQNELGLDPHSGVTVVFRSKRGDRVKILVWDGTGLVLTYKRLENGQFSWPQIRDGVMRLSRAQFEALFEGLDWRRVAVPLVQVPAAAD